ncbi:MAG: hypothetical protein UV01_C0011G0068 [Parcubacteria group bacterium GW2011_GWA2_42_14]|nr:MAG: hypothetical protein UV01_C0011G0068 [Parcubacteria group bacterium GW2011_GWA2_42_14]
MSEKGLFLLSIWVMWSLGTIVMALKNPVEATAFGVLGGIAAAIVTVKLLKK